MGCTATKLYDEEAVKLCRERKNFVKQAIELRNRFASDHIAYIQSLGRVSAALIHYVEGHDHPDFFFNSNLTPTLASGISGVPLKSLTSKQKRRNYLKPGRNPSVSVEESPEPEVTERIESYFPIDPYSGTNYSYLDLQSDQLWNPLASLGSYGYPSRFDRIKDDDDDVDGLRQIREEEGIPELEEVYGEENKENLKFCKGENKNDKPKAKSKKAGGESSVETNQGFQKKAEVENKSLGSESPRVSETQGTVDIETPNQREVEGTNGVEETPGYTVYVNRRPTSMAEVMKDIENQFMRICKSTLDVSVMLEASRARNSLVSSEQAGGSSASRFRQASSTSKMDINDIYCMARVSHQATLDRLYEWEKKLYEEVKAGEQVRIEYEKKCMQLSHHDIYGEEPSAVDRTIASIRELHTHFNVYIHTADSISKRIEALRDAELFPQLMKLIQGLSQMWKTIADSHRIQKHTIECAKLLPFSKSPTNPSNPSHAAATLAAEIRNWRRRLSNWTNSNRSYAQTLSLWASLCTSPDAAETPPVLRVCGQWSRMLESVSEKKAVEGMRFFAAGMKSVEEQQREVVKKGMAVPEMGRTVMLAGMAVAVGSVAEFAGGVAEEYGVMVRKWRSGGRREMLVGRGK